MEEQKVSKRWMEELIFLLEKLLRRHHEVVTSFTYFSCDDDSWIKSFVAYPFE